MIGPLGVVALCADIPRPDGIGILAQLSAIRSADRATFIDFLRILISKKGLHYVLLRA